MPEERKPLHNFNTETMSGIYPGSRTILYQRLRLHNKDEAQGKWYQLQWYSEPSAAILFQVEAQANAIAAVLTLPNPRMADFSQRLHEELATIGLQASACFVCRYWQPLRVHTDDGLPAGRCRWNDVSPTPVLPSSLATQSALSLSCEHFQSIEQPHTGVGENTTPSTNHPRVLKSAELDPDRLPFWPRLWHHLFRRHTQPTQDWADQVIERSGVGAGTEPCFVCQGRLANLGALAVASPEGDKQTLSIWRCRSCYTTYLNDWIDRWERLENLETEERYYRLAPAEAYDALSIIYGTKGGEHPGRRQERRQQRAQILDLISDRQPLSHQVRQGR